MASDETKIIPTDIDTYTSVDDRFSANSPHGVATQDEIKSNLSGSNASQSKETHVYKRRWYILLLYGLVTMINGYVTNLWSVIAASAEVAFQWTDHDISFIVNWGSICYLVGLLPFAWITSAWGFRWATLLSTGLQTLGCVARVITFHSPTVLWMAHIGQILNALAGPLSFSGAIILSDRWFPPEGRTTATAIGSMLGFIGNTICYIITPLGVKELPPGSNVTTKEINEIINDIKVYRYGECGLAVFVFILVVIYFPDRPPKPPSLSAGITDETGSFLSSLRQLFRIRENLTFWMVALAFGISVGTGAAWGSLIDVILSPIGVSEADAGLFGFIGGTFGIVGTILIGRIADYWIGRMKMFLLVLIFLNVLVLYWNLLLCVPYITYDRNSMIVVSVLSGILSNAPIPLFMEFSVEAAYPVSGTISSGIATAIYQIPVIATLGVFTLPGLGVTWLNWLIYASALMAFPLVLFAKEEYRRLEVDKKPVIKAEETDNQQSYSI